jgi:hypothetical protein
MNSWSALTGGIFDGLGWSSPRYALLKEVCRCESGLNPTARNYNYYKNPTYWSASGLCQITRSTWNSVPPSTLDFYNDVLKREANWIKAKAIWNDGKGASHWAASRNCWAH